LKRFTTSSSVFSDSGVDEIKLPKQIQFLLCQRCFWCASYIGTYTHMITECPSCSSGTLESMSICEKEAYQFDYRAKRGVTLEFSKIVETRQNKGLTDEKMNA